MSQEINNYTVSDAKKNVKGVVTAKNKRDALVIYFMRELNYKLYEAKILANNHYDSFIIKKIEES